MDHAYYLHLFQQAAAGLDKKRFQKKQIEPATGVYLDSIVFKLYKLSWANKTPDPLTAPSRIFFSVWLSDQSIRESKLMYNIHALKLRQLNGYSITSRQFAAEFRKTFRRFEKQWPNVSTDFGPLTLMEGWMKLNETSLQDDLGKLLKQFLEIEYLIDELLEKHRKR